MSADQALVSAQRYLDIYLPGMEAEADAFYGYYTVHIPRDGRVSGMLSVNGYSRQVFVHMWQGDLVAISENHTG